MSIFELYLITVISNAATLFGFAVFSLSLSIVICFIGSAMAADLVGERTLEGYWKAIKLKQQIIALVVCAFVGMFAPSERQIYMIIGGAYATNIEGVNELPENVVKAANEFLKQYQGAE